MNLTRYCWGVLGVCSLFGCGQAAPRPSLGSETERLVVPTQANTFAVLATGHATFGDRDVFTGGDVGVAPGTGDSVTAGSDAQIALGSYMLGQRIVFRDRAHVGNLAATTVVPASGATYASLVAYAAPPVQPPIVAFTAGTTPLQVNTPTTLAPGNFGLVTVNSTLTLSGGTYQFQNLSLNNNAVVQATGVSIVRVAGRVSGGNLVRLFPTGNQPASTLRLIVAGATDTTGGVVLGTDARVTAIVVSRASFGASDRFVGKGAIAARNVTIGTDASFTFQAGIECNADTACDDHNPCTTDACTDARCVHTALANGTACTDDGNVCTTDVCAAGTCNHAALADGAACTDDGNPCTTDACRAGACGHATVADGSSCGSSGGACGGGTCANVTCTGGGGSNNSAITSSAVVDGLAVSRSDTMTVQADGSHVTDVEIAINGALAIHQTFSGPDASGTLSESIDYGTGIHGIIHAEFFTDGSTITGTVDGRALLPFAVGSASDSSALVFADGGALPTLSVDPGVTDAVSAISRAVAAPTACGSTAQPRQFFPEGLPGGAAFGPAHTGSFPACNDCLGICEGAYVGCDTAAVGGCIGLAVATAPISWLTGTICGAAALYSCDRLDQSCKGSCRDPGKDCCPIRCTQGCCGTGDTCVNNGLPALCCDAGLQVCAGPKATNCVDTSKAVCLPSGLACPNGTNICGTGADKICCLGTCNGALCTPTPNFGIDVAVTTSTTPGYFDICTTGNGFTPGGPVTLSFGPLPGTDANTPRPGYVFDSRSAAGDGTYSINEQLSVNAIFCGDPNQVVVITATDPTTGGTAVTNLPGRLFCTNGNDADYNGGCP